MLERAVIYLGENFSAIRRNDERHLYAQAGASLTRLCRTAAGFSLSGLEFAYGIPGSVGGGIYMNAGAYGGELKDVVESVDYLDEDGNRHTLTVQELAFGYRRSMFSYRKCCILGASFALVPGDHQAIAARMEDVMQRRREKQPLEYPSAGSTFKRPEGAYAAELIDRCGLKGVSVGDAQVSEKHAGFLINRGNATCADMLGLIEIVRRTVLEQTGFLLEREVELLETEG